MYTADDIKALKEEWNHHPRWKGVKRPYSAEEVIKLQGSLIPDYPLARMGAQKLWELLSHEPFVRALGAMTGLQGVQQVQAGLKAIYVSGWQVAADQNLAYQTYPDQSLYPTSSAPSLVKRLNNALMRADQITHMENRIDHDWFVPIVADAEAGFGGPLNVFELTRSFIDAGAAAIHLEDQISSLKKCGHMGGKVLDPINVYIEKLIAARLAADTMKIPLLIVARTDAEGAQLIRSSDHPVDQKYLTGKRTPEGYTYIKGGTGLAIDRAVEYAPYADLIWCETSTPDLEQAQEFAEGIHKHFPGKWLAYNCSPSFNWQGNLSSSEIATFQEELGKMGYKFQFVTLAGFHTLNASMFDLASNYKKEGMKAYSRFQQYEFDLQESHNFTAVKHQSFVGTGYFDEVQNTVLGGNSSTRALEGSTEQDQF